MKIKQVHFLLLFLCKAFLAQAAAMHCILVGDTTDPDFERGAERNIASLWQVAQKGALYADLELQEQLFTDKDFDPGKVLAALESLEVDPDDVIFFYYAGHGLSARAYAKQPWPILSFKGCQGQGLGSFAVASLLAKKKARLTLVILEACNHRCPGLLFKDLLEQWAFDEKRAGYRQLFLQSAGVLVAASSRVGQISWMQPRLGSLFTQSLLRALETQTKSRRCSWEAVMQATCKETKELSLRVRGASLQEPIYLWHSTSEALKCLCPEEQEGEYRQ